MIFNLDVLGSRQISFDKQQSKNRKLSTKIIKTMHETKRYVLLKLPSQGFEWSSKYLITFTNSKRFIKVWKCESKEGIEMEKDKSIKTNICLRRKYNS